MISDERRDDLGNEGRENTTNHDPRYPTMCGKRTAHFVCTLAAGHRGPHGRAYRRPASDPHNVATTHTPNQAPVNQYGKTACGCQVSTDEHLRFDFIVYCPTHAQAPAMLAAWQSVFDLDLDDAIETYIPYPTKVRYRVVLDKARAILRVVEG